MTDLIRDLAVVLRGALDPSAQLGPSAALAARRLAEQLGVTPGELTAGVEDRLREVLGIPTYADEGLADGTDVTPEHLAMTGLELRDHLDHDHHAEPLALAVGNTRLRDLHVRRHRYNRPEPTP